MKRLVLVEEDKPQAGEQLLAHKRFSHLTTKSVATDESTLPLPDRFQSLLNVFKTIDQLVWTHTKRNQLCAFKKLHEMYHLSTGKALKEEHLVKMQTVGEIDGTSWFKLSHTVHEGEPHLTIQTSLDEKSKVECINSVTILLERERHFRSILLELVKKSHLEFLGSMNIQIDTTSNIFRWHTMFKLDSVPDIVSNYILLPKIEEFFKKMNKNSILNYLVSRHDTEVILDITTTKDSDTVIKNCSCC